MSSIKLIIDSISINYINSKTLLATALTEVGQDSKNNETFKSYADKIKYLLDVVMVERIKNFFYLYSIKL